MRRIQKCCRGERNSVLFLTDAGHPIPGHHIQWMLKKSSAERLCCMARLLSLVIIGSVASILAPWAGAQADQNLGGQSALNADIASGAPSGVANVLPPLPALPRGKSTVIGGVIRNVDLVRDQITLDVFGGRSMKVLFDERTIVYRDGKKSPLDDLRPGDHASVETVLDGTDVFAQTVHMLSHAPQGQTQGQVLSYDPGTRELTVRDAISQAPIKLTVPANASIAREGQPAFASETAGSSDLMSGSLVQVNFQANNQGGGIANQITILATPGSRFVFSGNIAFLDLHANTLVVQDPRDDKSYKISFNPAQFPVSRNLHEGSRVTVTANFNGSGYVASAIASN